MWSASLSLHTRQKWRLWRSLHAGHALQWGPSPADGAAATAMPSPSKLPLSSPAMLPNTEPPPPKAMVNMPDGGPAGCVDAPPDACEALAAFSAALFASAVAAALAMMEAASERPRPELVPRAWREVYAMLTGNRGYVRGKGFQVGSKAAHGSRNRVQTEHQLSHSHTKLLLALSHEPSQAMYGRRSSTDERQPLARILDANFRNCAGIDIGSSRYWNAKPWGKCFALR